MKKKVIIAISCVLVALLVVGGLWFFTREKEEKLKLTPQALTTDNLSVVLNDDGVPTYITGEITNTKVTDEESALKAVESIKDVLMISGDVSDELYLLESNEVGDVIYYELQQKYSGYDVYGAELTLSVDKDGNVLGVNGSYIPGIYVSTYGLLSEDEVKTKLNSVYGTDTTYYSLDKYIYVDANEDEYMVYSVVLLKTEGIYEVLVDAKTGKVLDEYELYDDLAVEYTGKGLNDVMYTVTLNQEKTKKGDIYYEFYDSNRNIVIDSGIGYIKASDDMTDEEKSDAVGRGLTNMILGFVNPIEFTVVDDVLFYDGSSEGISKQLLQNSFTAMAVYSDIYDYYYNVLGRKSYDGKGGKIGINVMFANSDLSYKYANAGWLPYFNEMIIGFDSDGNSFVLSKDVLAHEFTHGVVAHTSKFKDTKDKKAPNETGALNEAYADIMGALIEGENWEIGEMNGGIRSLSNPEINENPSKKGDEYYFPDRYLKDRTIEEFLKANDIEDLRCDRCDNGGEHVNSTVISHSAYLMYENGAFKNKEEMAKVWYNSLFLLSSYSDFEDAAYAVIQSAVNLGLSDDKIEIIKEAFYETKVLADEYHDFSGVVTNDDDKALEGVLVTAVNKLNVHVKFEVYTDKDGKYVFDELPEGEYDVVFDKAKHVPLEKEVELTKDKDGFDVSLEAIEEEDYEDAQVVFVMDISSSMFTSDPTDVRKRIIVNVLSSLDSRDDVALVIFAKNADTINNGLSDKAITKKVLMTDVYNISNNSGYGDNAGTNGKAGLKKAIGLFEEDTEKRKYIVFLTDGQDNISDDTSYDDLIKKANKKDIRVLTIGLGSEVDSSNLKKIATETNGRYYYADSSTDLAAFDYKIFAELE